MSLFEFLMVLVSIIVGLGIAEILTGVARQIRCRDSAQAYWVHSLLIVSIFFALIQQWWELWELRVVPEWTFIALLLLLAGPVCLFLIAHLLFPKPMEGAQLRDYYYGVMRPVWWLAAAAVIASTSFRPIMFDSNLFTADNATSFILLLGFVVLATSRRPILHSVLVPLFSLLLLLDILQFNFAVGPT